MSTRKKAAASQQAILAVIDGVPAPGSKKVNTSRTYPAHWTDHKRKRRQKTFPTAKGRDNKLQEVKDRGETWQTHRKETFDDAAKLFIELMQQSSRKASVKAAYQRLLELHILPSFTGRFLQSIDRLEIYLFRCKLAISHGLDLVKRLTTVLRQVFSLATAKGREWIKDNPAIGLPALRGWVSRTIINELAARARLNLLTIEQIRLLLAHSSGALGVAVAIAVLAGLRIGEIVALRWDDIQFADPAQKRGFIMVRFTADRKGALTEPKSEAGTRTIPFGPRLFDILMNARPADAMDQDYVVSDGGGQPVCSANLSGRFRLLQPRLGIGSMRRVVGATGATWLRCEGVFNFHMLRHACAALWIWKDVPVKTMARWLGHADEKLSLDTYGYLFRYRRKGDTTWPLPHDQKEYLAA